MNKTFVNIGMLAGLIALMPAEALAQPPADPQKPAVDVTKAMLDAAAKIGAAALKPGVSVSDRNIAVENSGGYNVTVAYVTRPATQTMSGTVLIHDKITEIYYVLSGSGTQETGTMVNGQQTSGSTTIGPGWSSTSPLKDGKSITLRSGEMQIIPPGMAHVWTSIADGGITYMVIRVDPDHLLALSK